MNSMQGAGSPELKTVPISQVEPWPRNPRGISEAGFQRLKRQIERHGVFKPLVVMPAGKKWVVLGGNMRLRAYRELGHKEVEISVVHPKTEAEALEYALSDNDRVGRYDLEALAKALDPIKDRVVLEDYHVALGDEEKVPDFLKKFGPGSMVQEKELDESLPTTHECKECGYKW